MDVETLNNNILLMITTVGVATTAVTTLVTAYFTFRTQMLATRNNAISMEVKDIAIDTNKKTARAEEIMEDVRHQTNAMTEQLVQATAKQFQLAGEQAGREQERGTIDEREAERSNLQAERQAERAEDRAERQEMRESWQAHERGEGRRGLPDGEAHE